MTNANWIGVSLKLSVLAVPLAAVVLVAGLLMPSTGRATTSDKMLTPGRTTAAQLLKSKHVRVYAHGDEFWYLAPGRLNMAAMQNAATTGRGTTTPVLLSKSSVLEFDGKTHILKAIHLQLP